MCIRDSPYSQVLQEHIALYKEQFDRVRLDLGTSERAKLETVKRLSLIHIYTRENGGCRERTRHYRNDGR